MSHRPHRFGFGRREEAQITPDDFESMLSDPLPNADADSSFEDAVLGQVERSRPFLCAKERRRVRWGRATAIGLGIGLFASGVMSVRAGLFTPRQEPGVVSSFVSTVQAESQTPVETVSTGFEEALAKLTSSREAAEDARSRAERCRDRAGTWQIARSGSLSRSGGTITFAFSMHQPASPVPEQTSGIMPTVIVFDDGLAIPAGSATSACPALNARSTARWPDPVSWNLENLGLEGSSELAIGGSTPPWYGSDVVRLPSTDHTARSFAKPRH